MNESKNTEVRPGVLRTPDRCFDNLPGFDFSPHYADILGYRVHYLDEGDPNAQVVLMMHGEPTWCFLYRKMISPVVAAGYRVIAPDLIGFGRSDKPVAIETHSYAFHVEAINGLLENLDLRQITLVGQDWGSLIGLRVLAENPQRFARVLIANGGLPNGDSALGEGFQAWRNSVIRMRERGDMDIGRVVGGALDGKQLDAEVKSAYEAPFPDGSYKAGPLALPLLVPVTPDDPAAAANKEAWKVLMQWQKPFITAFSDGDPVTRGGERIFQRLVPGAVGQNHTIITEAGHFLQEEKGVELAAVLNAFIAANPVA